MKRITITSIFIGLSVICTFGQTTEFTYQGNLKDNAAAANGNYDFEFALFDALAAGSQIGATIPKNNVPVANGIFSVKLDFGSLFPGADRYLEIRVRVAGQPGITVLGPRQLVNSAPYAIKSQKAEDANLLEGINSNGYFKLNNNETVTGRPAFNGGKSGASSPFTVDSNVVVANLNADRLNGLNSTDFAPAAHTHNVTQITNAASTAAPNDFTRGQLIQTGASGNIGLVVRGAPNQTARLQEWQNSSGAVLASVGPTGSLTLTGNLTLPVSTRIYSIAGPTFVSSSAANSYLADSNDIQGAVPGQAVVFRAPVHLPNGATITQHEAILTDNDGSALAMVVRLHRINSNVNSVNLYGHITSSGASTGAQTLTSTTFLPTVVDNANSYYIQAEWTVPPTPANFKLHFVRITYTVTSPLP